MNFNTMCKQIDHKKIEMRNNNNVIKLRYFDAYQKFLSIRVLHDSLNLKTPMEREKKNNFSHGKRKYVCKKISSISYKSKRLNCKRC